jgi:hypothetical protein
MLDYSKADQIIVSPTLFKGSHFTTLNPAECCSAAPVSLSFLMTAFGQTVILMNFMVLYHANPLLYKRVSDFIKASTRE